jgi:hypothetical protein
MPKNAETELDPPIIDDTLLRLNMVQQRDGFFPTSLSELTEALELGNKQDRIGGTARHLNDALLHKKKKGVKTDDPNAVVRRLAHDYVDYYQSAKQTTEYLKLLDVEVKEIDNPYLSLEITLGLDHLGLAGMVRYMDLRRIVSDGLVKDAELNPLKTDYTKEPTPATLHYIANMLKDLRIKSARYWVPLSLQDQQNRSDFWHQCLVESVSHNTAKPIVMPALKE